MHSSLLFYIYIKVSQQLKLLLRLPTNWLVTFANVVDDIERIPPVPFPPQATDPENQQIVHQNFKTTSGWFNSTVQKVAMEWHRMCRHMKMYIQTVS